MAFPLFNERMLLYWSCFLKGAAGWMSKKNTLKREKVYSELSVIRIVREILFPPSIHTCDMCSLKVMTIGSCESPSFPSGQTGISLPCSDELSVFFFSFNLSFEQRFCLYRVNRETHPHVVSWPTGSMWAELYNHATWEIGRRSKRNYKSGDIKFWRFWEFTVIE